MASYRPCQRCQPLCPPEQQLNPVIQQLIAAIEAEPQKRWKTQDLRELGIDDSTARRQFQKKFGMTFLEYARSRRMGLAMEHIKQGKKIIDAQLDADYDSSSGFRDAFSRVLGAPPTKLATKQVLVATWIETQLGPMLAIADEAGLYLLEFVSRRGLEKEVERLRYKLSAAIIPGDNGILQQVKQDLSSYFSGKDFVFKVPIHILGSEFQRKVWQQLQQIAQAIGQPTACRAVARANGSNQLALIIPCHRVINASGELGGYAGGIDRKSWLLMHEKGESHEP